MLFFMIVFVFFLSLLGVLVNNVVVWWSIFLLMTLLFVSLNKGLGSYSSLFNYFVMQESLGLLFLLLTFGYLQLLVLLMKIGVAPLHFWLFSVVNNIYGFNLMWFLTFQKLPFLLVLLQLLFMNILYILFVGLMLCVIQMILVKSYKNLLVLSSTESFNWVVMSFMMSFLSVLMIFVYYFFLMVFLILKFEGLSGVNYLGWETVLVFMNLPFSINFFIKIFSLLELLKFFSVIVLFLLLMMFMSMLSLSFWLVNLSVKSFFSYNKLSKFLISYFLLCMLLIIY